MSNFVRIQVLATVLGFGLLAGHASATSVTLTSNASQAAIWYGSTNTGAYSSANPRSGVYFLYRDGTPVNGDHIQDLVQQTYFYRIGNSGPASEINTGTTVTLTSSSASTATIKYAHSQFDMTVSYILSGSNPGDFTNALTQHITIRNKTGGNLNLHLFSYSDYTLTGLSTAFPTPGNPYADNNTQFIGFGIADGYEYVQAKAGGMGFDQWDTWGTNTGKISQLVTTYLTPANKTQVGFGGNGAGSLLAQLTSADPGLIQSPLTLFGGQADAGQAVDVAFAGQWIFNLTALQSVTVISETSLIVPEPATLALLALTVVPVVMRRRNRC